MYKIYILKFPNGKNYIGCTKTSLNARSGTDGKKYRAKALKEAILKYGWKNIKQEILKDDLTYEEAKFYEKFYIKRYKTTNQKFGYNKFSGGEFAKKIFVYPHVMTSAKWDWINTLKGKTLNENHKKNISDSHTKRLKYFIIQYDLDGNFIKQWNSACEIQRELGISKQMISNCYLLNESRPEKTYTSHGFIWKRQKKESLN